MTLVCYVHVTVSYSNAEFISMIVNSLHNQLKKPKYCTYTLYTYITHQQWFCYQGSDKECNGGGNASDATAWSHTGDSHNRMYD